MIAKKQIVKDLIGCLLGDGCLVGNKIRIGHKANQLDYLKHKVSHFARNGLCVSKIWHQKTKDYYACNITIPEPYRKWFDYDRYHTVKGKRFVSEFLLKRVSCLGWLFYYLDDGNLYRAKHKNGKIAALQMSVSVGSYSYHNLEVFQSVIQKNDPDLKISLVKCGSHYKLRAGGSGFKYLFKKWEHYLMVLPECMLYKFDSKYTRPELNPFTLEYLQVQRKRETANLAV